MWKITKDSLKSAAGIAVGTTMGCCVLPRLLFKEIYNETWPPIWKQAVLYFVVGYIAAFSVCFLINLAKRKKQK